MERKKRKVNGWKVANGWKQNITDNSQCLTIVKLYFPHIFSATKHNITKNKTKKIYENMWSKSKITKLLNLLEYLHQLVGRNFFWVKDTAQKSKEKEGGKAKKKKRIRQGGVTRKSERKRDLELVEKLTV